MKKNNGVAVIVLSLTFIFSGFATADSFPERPIELVVPFGAGGTTDVLARAFSKVMGKYLPNEQRLVVVNKPGGAATIGMGVVAAADPDGYTLAFTPSGPMEIMPHYGQTNWGIENFEPVLSFLEIPTSINVLNSSELKTYEQWKQHARANPGKFTYTAAGGVGGNTHLAMEMFGEAEGVDIRHIPHEGQAASHAAILGGHVDSNFSTPDLHQGGNVRPLVFLSAVKPVGDVYDDVPFTTDLDIPVVTNFPVGVLAPKGVPAERIEIIHRAFKEALRDPVVMGFFESTGFPGTYRDGDTFQEGIQERSAENKRLLEQMNLVGNR